MYLGLYELSNHDMSRCRWFVTFETERFVSTPTLDGFVGHCSLLRTRSCCYGGDTSPTSKTASTITTGNDRLSVEKLADIVLVIVILIEIA